MVNVFCMCATVAPVTAAIIDAAEHLKAGRGKKDATYVANYMEAIVSKYDLHNAQEVH